MAKVTYTLEVDDESGRIRIIGPDHETLSFDVNKALNFVRRELQYYTAPYSTIWGKKL